MTIVFLSFNQIDLLSLSFLNSRETHYERAKMMEETKSIKSLGRISINLQQETE